MKWINVNISLMTMVLIIGIFFLLLAMLFVKFGILGVILSKLALLIPRLPIYNGIMILILLITSYTKWEFIPKIILRVSALEYICLVFVGFCRIMYKISDKIKRPFPEFPAVLNIKEHWISILLTVTTLLFMSWLCIMILIGNNYHRNDL